MNAQFNQGIKAAAPPDTGPPDGTGRTLSISLYSGSLNFGTFYFENTGGTISLDPISGNSTISGDIILFKSVPTVPIFELFAQNNTNVIITSPKTFKLFGNGPFNSGDELDGTLQFDKPSYQSIDKFTPIYIYMGGTLTVDNTDNPGPYYGTINVTVAFE
ncbi:DUF4402 domain-containing protein [Salinimicrobium flavum]|uniref:DUF4402 domain-containing protein n=1 Tax=Salinimicrobium flavum TaxID=1737065 RepID=A0ABW5J0K4_9FLAO